ncbi:MAG: GNAT family N-acetyltransferase [Acidobacteria bacterium]|nr:MAG: GNAT family N-acetyltransferase [Acidobacteriota bacterium]
MSSLIAERAAANLQVVDLCRVRPHELRRLWEREARLWRQRFDWDVTTAMSALERAVDRGGLVGKAIRCDGVTAAYAYYVVEGDRGVISGLVVSPAFRDSEIGRMMLQAILEDLYRRGVRRIETQFVCFDAPWLAECFEAEGFQTFWRDFLRRTVSRVHPDAGSSNRVVLLRWTAWNLSEMAALMERAHRGGADAEMNELYRSSSGCRLLLNNIVRQRGCGKALTEVSTVAREPSTDAAAGFAIVTEIAKGHGHLAQVAVDPIFQRQGVGRLLVTNTLDRLAAIGIRTLSLMVSRDNDRALHLYRSLGFESIYRFPVFSLER